MIESLINWFSDHQLKLMAVLGAICSVIMLAIGGLWLSIVAQTVVCLIIAFIGSLLYMGETTENWLEVSWSGSIRDFIGRILIGIAWLCFIGGGRGGVGVLVQTIASIVVKLG